MGNMKAEERRRSGRRKHSYVPFYFDDWNAGTADMPRLVQSVYFQICKHSWDKAQPVSRSRLMIMLADLGSQGDDIVLALIEDGQLVRDGEGGVFSPRALKEGQIAFDLWERKSNGGKRGKGAEGEAEESSSTPPKSRQENQTHIQNHTHEKEKGEDSPLPPAAPAEPDRDLLGDPAPDPKPKRPTKAECVAVMEAWNAMAVTCGLSQTIKMTEEHEKHTRCRIEEHGMEKILEVLEQIPSRPFLLGDNDRDWKAGYKWFVRPDSIQNVIDGQYKTGRNGGGGKPSGWRDL